MITLKPYQKIASKFKISEESAKYFLGRVQKSFKKEKPPHALIMEVMDSHESNTLPEPYDIALLMYNSGLWKHDVHSPPAALVDEG